MAGLKRVLGLRRALSPGALTCVVLGATACDLGEITAPGAGDGQNQSAFAGSSSSVAGGPVILDPVPSAGGAPGLLPAELCTPASSTDPVFKAQFVTSSQPARREFFSWTTDEQAAALRTDQVLFTKSEQEGAGPGYAFTYLSQFISSAQEPQDQTAQGELARALSNGDLFAKKRYAWSEPWATRMGWPGEDYGNNLLRIVLKPEALLVVLDYGELKVFDLDNNEVAVSDVLGGELDRIGAIFFVKDAFSGGPDCGTFSNGTNGYREFILGNLAMVEEWSIGTQQIRDRLTSNIADLTRFFGQIRDCPSATSGSQWNAEAACTWALEPNEGEIFTYEQALAMPSENYLPVPAQIAALIETLQGDLFEPDPLVVKPGSQ